MRSPAPSLLPIFRSQHQASLLAELYLRPQREATVTDLAAAVGVPLTTAAAELTRLTEAGLITSRPVGRARLLRAATDHPAAAPLTQLLQLMFGPPTVLTEEFTNLPGVQQVVLFGSWAARHAGTDGPPPADIDILVIGRPRRSDVYAAAERAQARLVTPVNPVLRTPEQWRATPGEADALVADVHASPHLVLLDATSANQTEPAPGSSSEQPGDTTGGDAA